MEVRKSQPLIAAPPVTGSGAATFTAANLAANQAVTFDNSSGDLTIGAGNVTEAKSGPAFRLANARMASAAEAMNA